VVVDESNFSRLRSSLGIVEPLSSALLQDDRNRTLQLLQSRLK